MPDDVQFQHFSLYCHLLSWFQHDLIFKFSTNVCCQVNYIVSFSSSKKKSCILVLKYTTTSTPVDAPKRQKREPLHVSTQSLMQILIISSLCIIQHVNLSSSVNILMSSSVNILMSSSVNILMSSNVNILMSSSVNILSSSVNILMSSSYFK